MLLDASISPLIRMSPVATIISGAGPYARSEPADVIVKSFAQTIRTPFAIVVGGDAGSPGPVISPFVLSTCAAPPIETSGNESRFGGVAVHGSVYSAVNGNGHSSEVSSPPLDEVENPQPAVMANRAAFMRPS
jgi:hypothetical protein